MAYERKRRIFQVPNQSLAVDDDHAVIKYLEGVIKLGCHNVAIYNYLVSLYADLKDEGPLFRFLSALIPESKGVHHQSNFLGVVFELTQCIHLFSSMVLLLVWWSDLYFSSVINVNE
jgi:hypothetical protein